MYLCISTECKVFVVLRMYLCISTECKVFLVLRTCTPYSVSSSIRLFPGRKEVDQKEEKGLSMDGVAR